jgi:anti-sigma28 factor (negative regulator of flagellin synthesis)
MRINSIPPKELLNRYIHVRGKTTDKPAASPTDQTELTSEAKTFSAALKAAKEAIETRTPEQLKHIEEVKKQVTDGTYSVPGEKVAEKILGKSHG